VIRYNLICDKRHEFESWFASSSAYDKQAKRGLVACPMCGSTKVDKAIMAPRLGRSDKAIDVPAPPAAPTPPAPAPQGAEPVAMISPQERELRTKLKELRDHLTKNAENVGRHVIKSKRRGRLIRTAVTPNINRDDPEVCREMRDLIHPQIVVERIGMNHDEGQTFAGNFVVDSQAVRGGIGHRKKCLKRSTRSIASLRSNRVRSDVF